MRVRNLPFLAIVFCLIAMLASTTRALQPGSAEELRLTRIQQRIQSGDLESAKTELEKALSQSPGDPRLFNFLGVVEAQQNHFEAAELNFRKAIQASPRFSGAYMNLGRLYQEHPDQPRVTEKAIAVYQKLLHYDPDHVEANYQAALLLNRAGNHTASLQHLSRLPAELRKRSAALALECANQMALGRTKPAEAAGTELLKSSDLNEADVIAIVPVLHKHGGDNLAMVLLEGLETRNLASSQTLRRSAQLQEAQGRFKEARVTLEKSLALEQPSADLLARLARVAYRSGDLDGALGYLAHARDLEPGNAAVHFFFGMICVELKLPPEAKKSLQEALRLDPDNPYYHYAFGAVLTNGKNADEAIPHFRKYRDARPNDPRGAFALGVAYFDAYDLDSARKEFLSIADNQETRMGAQLYLGRLALAGGNEDEALVHFQKAIQANPAIPEAYAESALVRIRREEYELAERDLTHALARTPDHYLSNLRLLMLYQRKKDPRAEAQGRRVEQLQKAGEERERLLLRSLEIRPYSIEPIQ